MEKNNNYILKEEILESLEKFREFLKESNIFPNFLDKISNFLDESLAEKDLDKILGDNDFIDSVYDFLRDENKNIGAYVISSDELKKLLKSILSDKQNDIFNREVSKTKKNIDDTLKKVNEKLNSYGIKGNFLKKDEFIFPFDGEYKGKKCIVYENEFGKIVCYFPENHRYIYENKVFLK